MVVFGAKLRSFEAKNQDALRALRNPALWLLSWSPVAALAALSAGSGAPGTHYLGPVTRPKKGRGVKAPVGSPTTNGVVAAETAPLLPAPRECERTARLHALRRAAAAARVCPPQLGTTRHRLPPERHADDHGLGLLAAPSFRFPADERATTKTAPVSVRSRERGAAAAPRRGRAQCRAGRASTQAAGLGGCGSFAK
jgi:hypothetical protein